MNILYTTDQKYIMPLTVSLTSLFENNKEEKIDVYIFHSILLEKQIKILSELAESYRQSVHMTLIDEHYFDNAPTYNKWSKEAYYLLLVNEYLPKGINKILYLDCDTVVNKNLDSLYKTDLGDKPIGVYAWKGEFARRTALGLNKDGLNFNSGVILFNLEKSREFLTYDKAISIIKNRDQSFPTVDEGVLNIMFDGNIKQIERKYNNFFVTNFYLNKLNRLFNKQNKRAIDETYIFHFVVKPWNNLYEGSCEEIWNKYLRISPYKDLFNKYNKLRYKILRTGPAKAILNEYLIFSPIINKIGMKILPKEIHLKLRNFYMKNIK